jgi:Polysaccharide lyase
MFRPALIVFALLIGFPGEPGLARADGVKEGFEGNNLNKDINPRFKLCHRPEGAFKFSRAKARSGKQSLELSVTPQPLFVKSPRVLWGLAPGPKLNPQHCLDEADEAIKQKYWADEYERAELWEDKSQNPKFGEGEPIFYGFSMWIGRDSAPEGDFNRLVLGQWKAGCKGDCEVSPFLGQRLTGGFYHITIEVDARPTKGDPAGAPSSCKILLAYSQAPPSKMEPPLDLDRATQCESRLQYPENDLEPVQKIDIKRERYLPDPFGKWTDLVFKVQGGRKDGVVQVWAGGKLIATATGWIGQQTSVGESQYFKFGPYRDPAGYGVKVYLDNLARGASYEEVDPSKF